MGAGVRSAMAERVMVMLPDNLRTQEVKDMLNEFGGGDLWWPNYFIKNETVKKGVLDFLKSIDEGTISQEEADRCLAKLDAADKAAPDWMDEVELDTWKRYTGGGRYYSDRNKDDPDLDELNGTSTLEHIKFAIDELLCAMNDWTAEEETEEVKEMEQEHELQGPFCECKCGNAGCASLLMK